MGDPSARIKIGEGSNVQDNVAIYATFPRDAQATSALQALGLTPSSGVELGHYVITAHGVTIKGPARIGLEGAKVKENTGDPSVFLSFGVEIDGAIIEKNAGVSALARVGPGVRIKSGIMVLPGKNVTTQAEADDPALGKVRKTDAADFLFNKGVIHVNEAFAREYPRLAASDRDAIRGISADPGHSEFNPARDVPRLTGLATPLPSFRNRIIGDVRLADGAGTLANVMGRRVSLRADEGEPFKVGRIARMGDDVIFHALEHSYITVGNDVQFGNRAIVHGGDRTKSDGTISHETIIGDGVVLADQAVVFRSSIGAGSRLGVKSLIVNSTLAPGTIIPDRAIYVGGVFYGIVEW
jgi:carbonic anhydrase/acetyltransferase-like protein (isoleucine patch superfamily)